eukprot:1108259-Alexandrium_andersonii.AAC.1
MSASLVGSEMCIRDRLTLSRTAPAATSDQLGSPTAALESGRSKSHPAVAVSYTHLTLPTICSV